MILLQRYAPGSSRRIRLWLLATCAALLVFAPAVLVAAPQPQEATPVAGDATVQIRFAMRVRGGPGSDWPQIGSVRPGDRFAITGQDERGSWWRIDFAGQDGWVYAGLVRAENADGVAVVDAPARPSFDPGTVKLGLQPVFSGLQLPVFLTHAGDGSGRLFIVEKPGRILIAAGVEDEPQVFLDIRDRVGAGGNEQGLLGLAFAPDYANSGIFYVNYTDRRGDTVVARFSVGADPDQADPESELPVLSVAQPASNHNGGMITFGPDGHLWIGLGDGGGANDRYDNGQNPETLLGAMLRIDVTRDPDAPYTIPADNPYVNDEDVLDEIWALGLRNPWRYSFDARTGDLWIGDVGQNRYEEINFIPAEALAAGGLNFGWPLLEGNNCFAVANCNPASYYAPIYEYDHAGNGCSVTGGYVYRGSDFPILDGVYFFSDYCSGRLWALWTTETGETRAELMIGSAGTVSSFGEDEQGELYVVDYRGSISQLVVE